MVEIALKLYVTGRTASAARAIAAVQTLQDEIGPARLAVEIIDVLDNPFAALNDSVFATPTVFRILPAPVRRVVGDFSSRERLVDALQLDFKNR
jgi:circadian clock protein KaiB